MDRLPLLRSMMLIRAVEERLMSRADGGFQLYSSGEEAVAVGLCAALAPQDQILSSGRAIAPALARGLDPAAVVAELLGRASGTNRGKAGRGHIADPGGGFFGAHTVVAGNLTIAAGVALACQQAGKGAIAACIFGDGACGAGVLHETLNIAALWRLPLLFVCNNNGLSVSTPVERSVAAAPLAALAAPHGIPSAVVDGMDIIAVRDAAAAFATNARAGGGPAFLECRSERFSSHSSATRETRSRAEMTLVRQRCPIIRLRTELEHAGMGGAVAALERTVAEEAERAFALADAAPRPAIDEAIRDVI